MCPSTRCRPSADAQRASSKRHHEYQFLYDQLPEHCRHWEALAAQVEKGENDEEKLYVDRDQNQIPRVTRNAPRQDQAYWPQWGRRDRWRRLEPPCRKMIITKTRHKNTGPSPEGGKMCPSTHIYQNIPRPDADRFGPSGHACRMRVTRVPPTAMPSPASSVKYHRYSVSE